MFASRSVLRLILLGMLGLGARVSLANGPWYLSTGLHYGFLWAHRADTRVLVERHAPAFSFSVERDMPGDRSWHHDFLIPRFGVSILHSDLGNPARIGSTWRAIPYLYLPFVRGANSSTGLRAGWGLGWVQHPFHAENNHKQVAIGSHLNTAIQLMIEHRRSWDSWEAGLGVGIDHWSNGAVRMPNLGLNYLSAQLQITRRFGAARPPSTPTPNDSLTKRQELRVLPSFGISEYETPGNGQFTAWSLTAEMQWDRGVRGGWAAGLDLFNKGTLHADAPELRHKDRLAATQLGVHGGYTLRMGRGELVMQMGTYLYTPTEPAHRIFNRFGGRYRIGRHWLAGITLKTHFAVADHWEFGWGYRF